jgi:hypothetical protein
MKNRWNIANQLRTVLYETFKFRDREGMEIGLPTFGKFRKQEKLNARIANLKTAKV